MARKKRRGKRHRRKSKKGFLGLLLRYWWVIAAFFAASASSLAVGWFLIDIPIPGASQAPESSQVLSHDGTRIATLHEEENRTVVQLEGVTQTFQDAVVATEDRNFFKHHGVSIRGILRASVENVRGGRVAQGGSTITQQYVRNAFADVGKERTLARKLREAVVSVKLERRFTKKEILEQYLNTVYFGRGAYGAEAAARSYFRKSAFDLSLGESAYLAGIIRAPQRYQPDLDSDAANAIRDEVLDDMVGAGRLTKEAAAAAKATPLTFRLSVSAEAETGRAAYFVEFIKQQLYDEFGLTDREIFFGGLRIHTTLDLKMQEAAENAITSVLDRPTDPEAALVAVDVQGRIKAMVGGRVVDDIGRARGFNFATGGRQAGSAFKPFTLAAFVDSGKSIKSTFAAPAQTTIESSQCRNKDRSPWKVRNFGDAEYGVLDVSSATTRSVNTVYAQMIDLVKPSKVRDIAVDAGISSRLSAVCSLTLGTSDVTPLEMARAYATFSSRGMRADVFAVTKIVGADGEVIDERQPKTTRAIDASVADVVNSLLQRNIAGGTGTAAQIGRTAAGKTGTTQNHLDAWFVGYTPDQISAAVWMGFRPDPKTGEVPTMTNVHGRSVTGGSFPAQIWGRFMREAMVGWRRRGFNAPSISGEVIKASPTPCPTSASPPADSNCVTPSASPSGKQSPAASASPPSPKPKPSPKPTSDER